MQNDFSKTIRPVSEVANNILRKRYFNGKENSWEEVVSRVVKNVLKNSRNNKEKELIHQMILNTYFIPNSPCLVNSGKPNGGLFACFVVDFPDTIEGIYKTKYDFALIARKGGGCGTTLSKLRPKNSVVGGSAHGYAGGPIGFYDTICHDMEVITQAGFRQMAQMGTMIVSHPDIEEFLTAKEVEGKMTTTNLSVIVTDVFMSAVEDDKMFWLEFGGKKYKEIRAKDLYDKICNGAWRNGEPGILFYEKTNKLSPYKYSNQEIMATNPCAEQPLPPNGCCNLGSLDISKFTDKDNNLDFSKLELASRLAVRFLDSVIDVNFYPTKDIEKWAKDNRAIGLGIMGFADYLLIKKIPYGSKESLNELENITKFIYAVAENESISLGKRLGIPKQCKKLPTKRRNVTLLSIAPTGTVSLIAGCSNGIEPIFSEIVIRNDKTGTYQFENELSEKEYFRCAVSANGAKEVTWEEHLAVLNSASKYVDSGVSKTINCPNHLHKETVEKIFMDAWKYPYIKGTTIYRNGSRRQEVLSPKNIKRDKCPICGKDTIDDGKCNKCSDIECGWSLCQT